MTNMILPPDAATRVAPGFLLRIAGQPLAGSAALDSPAWRQAMDRMDALEQELATLAVQLSDALYSAISAAPPEAQKTLLNLRRAIFNRRAIDARGMELAAPHLPRATGELLARWQLLRAGLAGQDAAAEQLLEQALPRLRRALKDAAGAPAFRQGLWIANPSFARTLDAYLQADDAHLNRKLRQAERTLLLYLLRTIHKTSPLSTLTRVSVGQLVDGGPDGAPRWTSWTPRQAARPNVAALARIARALSADLAAHPGLRLAVQEGACRKQGRVHYTKRSETALSKGGPMHSTVAEARSSLTLSSSLTVLLDLLAELGALRVGCLVDLLGERLEMAPAQAADYLQRLVNQGLLVVDGLRRCTFEDAPWERFADTLEESGEAALAQAAAALRTVQQLVNRFAAAPAAERGALLQAVHEQLSQALQLAGAEPTPPQPVLYEDASASTGLVAASRAAWQAPLDQLGEVQKLLGLFDPMLVSRLTLRSLFRKRYGDGGVCHDIAEFSDFFHDSFYRAVSATARSSNGPFGRGTLNALKLQEVSAIQDAQAELSAEVEALYAGAGAADEIALPEALVRRLGERAIGWQQWMTNAFFVQPAGSRLVLNRIYAGGGCTFGRFAHLYDGAAQQPVQQLLRSSLDQLHGAGVMLAELQGGHDSNLNLHPLLTEAELVLPGERGSAGAGQRIALAELQIRHDAARDQLYLYCERLQKRIVPLYLGMLYPLILPELQTLLLHFAPPAILRTDVFAGRAADSDAIVRLPRLRYRQVVLERARWLVPAAQLPQRAGGESDYRYLRRLSAWRQEAGLPRQAYVKILGTAVAGANQQIGGYGFGNKPVYIDFHQPLCLGLFEHLMTDARGRVQFTECLPDAADALTAPDGARHTHEFIFELTQGHLQ
jgi:hypothetical protein